ncbi:MAG: protein tyrosine phosphatase [Xanthobacteraceae bacterium]|nr:protein tyrosine phosphatase [Xanthobacteraceae bacterium]
MIHVCSLARLHSTIVETGARHVVTLLGVEDEVVLPADVPVGNHLRLQVHDITDPMDGYVIPQIEHVERLLHFVQRWRRDAPMVIHCYAGISRSTAAAFIAACALAPERDEAAIADALRAASPSATPNPLFVAIADRMLGRDGRMVAAIARIGRGADAFEGTPFCLTLT